MNPRNFQVSTDWLLRAGRGVRGGEKEGEGEKGLRVLLLRRILRDVILVSRATATPQLVDTALAAVRRWLEIAMLLACDGMMRLRFAEPTSQSASGWAHSRGNTTPFRLCVVIYSVSSGRARVIEVSMERHRNERAKEMGDPLTNGIVRHDSHSRKSGDPAGD
ncbi:hypothetical protein PR048_003884 [Dryococelus australis]|uniref:Uncharacterized protein n=1 Tax=Dryococelus australis TaxID=614101 RepID=A0ABQ9IQB6_9NEOP|nr:hypothetical protein PR048_003884 [Dryococelus australis]